MDEELIKRVLEAYGVHFTRLLPMQKGYRNENHPLITTEGKRLNLIVYKREQGIRARINRANRTANYLAEQGFPARRTYDQRVIRLYEGKYAALYEYLSGKTIPWEAYTMKHLKALGKSMGDMHSLLTKAEAHDLPTVADEYSAIAREMSRYFKHEGVREAMKQKLDIAIDMNIFDKHLRILAHCKQLPNQQALHMDFVRGNILFRHPIDLSTSTLEPITGVLDFEKVAIGHPLFDIARTYAFLVIDCKYKSPAEIKKYFLQSGYGKYSLSPFKLGSQHERLLQKLTELFLLYDFYKFLRHNPYEHLHSNEHYVRTSALLLSWGLLGKAGSG